MVTLVQEKAFDVFIRDFGVVKRVYCDVSMRIVLIFVIFLI